MLTVFAERDIAPPTGRMIVTVEKPKTQIPNPKSQEHHEAHEEHEAD
jgi:hypothetical protein